MWSLGSIHKVGELVPAVATVAVVISPKMHVLYLFMGPRFQLARARF
jgi:hypothetical protein